MAERQEQRGPIADLSYRSYDGPMAPPINRWWVISRMGISLAVRKRALWGALLLSAWYYIVMVVIAFFLDQMDPTSTVAQRFFANIQWPKQFLHGFGFGNLMFLIITLMLGASTIANDNRANALLMYLSKPCTKVDYLFGKWAGVFLPLSAMIAAPTLLYYAYGVLSYRDYGFISQDPMLLFKLLALIILTAGFHSSLIIGVSSLFKQGRMAGAAYAGIYFLSNFFTQLAAVTWAEQHPDPGAVINQAGSMQLLYYFSIDGIINGLAKGILGVDGGNYFGTPERSASVPAPPLGLMLLLVFGLSAIALIVARRRVRAVEVVA